MEVALITGCATGIGRALAEELHSRSTQDGKKAFKVYATDKQLASIKDLETQGLNILQLDVTDAQSVSAAVDHVLGTEGRIDLLVCNAGMAVAGWIAEVPVEDARRMFDVNVFGALRVAQAVLPSMMDRRSGRIATICSVNSYLAMAFAGSYAASKAALAMMTEALRIEVEPFGIEITSVVPGWVKSQILPNALIAYDRYERPDGQYRQLMDRVREFRRYLGQQGISCQKAAHDIANGLAKPKPGRFVYTGTWLAFALFCGFVQMWVWSGLIARRLRKDYHLHHTEKLGRGTPAATPKGIPIGVQKEE